MTLDENMLSTIMANLKDIGEQLRSGNQEAIKQRALIENLNVDLLEAIADIRALGRIVKDGNGRPSLLERTALLERHIVDQETSIKELHDVFNSRTNEDLRGKWQLAGIIVTAIFAAISSIMLVFFRGATH